MAGYECADQLNCHRQRVDLLTQTGHLQLIDEDYQLLQPFGIKTVREGIRWSVVEKTPYHYDWSTVALMLQAGQRDGIQQIWDICHFGFPDDLHPLHPDFTSRFVALCEAFARFYRSQYPTATLIVTPVNEVSFLSWLGGENCGTAPYLTNQGWEVKYHLMKAFIAGVAAMRNIDPSVKILTTEPLVNMVPPLNPTDEQIEEAAFQQNLQFQSLDMLCGFICPELGGKPEYADVLGFNFYYNNQWVIGQEEFLPWFNENPDPRWMPLHELLSVAYARYQKPMILSETSHSGVDRPNWLDFITNQCAVLLQQHIPLWGVCLYPIIDRPDWNDLSCWHHSGLWDVTNPDASVPERLLHQPYAEALLKARHQLEQIPGAIRADTKVEEIENDIQTIS
ncbi:beta-glucosidase [Mucilaginibacter koreensis]